MKTKRDRFDLRFYQKWPFSRSKYRVHQKFLVHQIEVSAKCSRMTTTRWISIILSVLKSPGVVVLKKFSLYCVLSVDKMLSNAIARHLNRTFGRLYNVLLISKSGWSQVCQITEQSCWEWQGVSTIFKRKTQIYWPMRRSLINSMTLKQSDPTKTRLGPSDKIK